MLSPKHERRCHLLAAGKPQGEPKGREEWRERGREGERERAACRARGEGKQKKRGVRGSRAALPLGPRPSSGATNPRLEAHVRLPPPSLYPIQDLRHPHFLKEQEGTLGGTRLWAEILLLRPDSCLSSTTPAEQRPRMVFLNKCKKGGERKEDKRERVPFSGTWVCCSFNSPCRPVTRERGRLRL